MNASRAPTADELPDPDPADARRAVVDAARADGLTCARGAFKARRTYVESEDAFHTYDPQNVVKLSLKVGYGGDTVGLYPVHGFGEVRDDWTAGPSPDWHDHGEPVLPAEEYDLADVFVCPAALPGGDA